ncbi:hypothetical protein SAMN05421819_3432 [Bryocella elongata]|uniref:FecR family protein n=1 Tax=Bryocella elongata TaxID=863522 RepID=A0A1H6B312_9BACT|nr:hypothetical protein [Bryocella elongata]SEG54607.1 hypothetical protein SAMN05421819_3432 [Bryocella elongata]
MRLSSLAGVAFPLAVSFVVAISAPTAGAQDDPQQPLPQIVRISYAEGDVRLERGKASGPNPTGWVAAKTGVPLESGFSLVTGQGRAEIEFEDTSTAYVDANTAVTFNQLTTNEGAPQTAVTLLTGTLTLHLTTTVRGERYLFRTPQHDLFVPYPDRSYVRLQSYLDGMDVTPLSALPVRVTSSEGSDLASSGHTLHYTGGSLPVVTPAGAESSAFDSWVTDRLSERKVELNEVMAQAGLSSPIPGLADLKQQGQFFSCAPYGTCWAPTNGWMNANALRLRGVHWEEEDDPFPCWTGRYRQLVGVDPFSHLRRVLYSEADGGWNYEWPVCHAGSWIHREHGGWTWVVGKRLHHRCPVHWVESGGHKGYVPIHPKDRPGLPPENLKYGLFTAADKHEGSIQRIAWNGIDPVKVLKDEPKDFRKEYHGPLPSSESPKLEARLEPLRPLGSRNPDGHPTDAHRNDAREFNTSALATTKPGTLTFNPKSQTFMLAHDVDHGGHTSSVVQPFGGRADSGAGHGGMASSAAFSGGGGNAGSFNHGGGGSSSGFNGGSSHSSGSSSGSSFSGGGSHASSPAPSAPSSAPAASSSGASSSGHH